MTYLEKKDEETVKLYGFEHLKDVVYVYTSPIDEKLVFNTRKRLSAYIKQFRIIDSEIKSEELVNAIEKVDGFDKTLIYNQNDESYYISPLPCIK